MSANQEWQRLYLAAIVEIDKKKMEERISEVEAAIRGRLQEFSLDHGGTPAENQEITNALDALKVLRTEVGNWPESKTG